MVTNETLTSRTEQEIRNLKNLPPDTKVYNTVIRRIRPWLLSLEKERLPYPKLSFKKGGGVTALWTSHARDLCIDFLPLGLIIVNQIGRVIDDDGDMLATSSVKSS